MVAVTSLIEPKKSRSDWGGFFVPKSQNPSILIIMC